MDPQGCVASRLNRPLRWLALCATLCISVALLACASLGSGNAEEQVRQRATERWQALVKGEFNRAYTFNTPGFRAVVTADGFRSRFGGAVTWLGAEVIRVNCADASQCVATVRIDYRPTLSGKNNNLLATHLDETWLLEAGQWWFFQKI